jgi:hypothetical protein
MKEKKMKAEDIKSFWIDPGQYDSDKGLSVIINGSQYILGGNYSEAVIRHLCQKIDSLENLMNQAIRVLKN